MRADGSAKLATASDLFTAADLKNSSGTALVIHQSADYLGSSRTDDSGERVACGVISAATAVPPPSASTSTSTSTSTGTVTNVPTVTSTPGTTVTVPAFP